MTNLIAAADTTTTIDLFKAGQAGSSPLPFSAGSTPNELFGIYLGQVLRSIMVIALIAVLIFLVWGGIEWITSGGEKSKTEGARNKITGAVIGLIVLASSLGIFLFVQRITGVQLFTIGRTSSSSSTSSTSTKSSNSGLFKKTTN